MKKQAESVADFIERIAALARRLTAINVAVHTVNLECGECGSPGFWSLIVTKGHEAVRVSYDGRDSVITVEVSPLRKYSYPNEWTKVLDEVIGKGRDEAIGFIEKFLRQRFAASLSAKR